MAGQNSLRGIELYLSNVVRTLLYHVHYGHIIPLLHLIFCVI